MVRIGVKLKAEVLLDGETTMTTKNNVPLATFILSAFAITSLSLAVPLQAQQRQTLQTQLAAPVGVQPIGHLPGSQRLRLALTLRLRNQQELQSLLGELYDPASPSYRQFLTVQQFTEQFGPTIEDYEKVTGFAEAHGLTVTHTAPNRLVLDVSGTVADIEQAFRVTMQVYQHPTEPRTFYAPNAEPSVDPAVPVQGVSGLNNFAPPHPMGLRQITEGETDVRNSAGSGPGGAFLGSDMRAAYAPGVTLNGTGQAVGLLQFGPYNLSDVQAYFSTINQPLNVPIVNVLLDGVTGVCGSGCDDTEEATDLEQVISMAPNLSAVIVYEGNSDVDILNQMATDNIAKQLSCSWGWLPADPYSDEPIFLEFALQGQNLFVASGDSGAYTPPSCTKNCNYSWYPADDPYITAAGGTDLTTSAPGGAWESETAWVGSGGGFSTNGISIPGYQSPAINSSNQGSTTLRNIPDVAAEANIDNYLCANGTCTEYVVGGTSLAAPRWAGFLALANQQANGTPIGFLNPTLYAIGQGSEYANDFHDITTGDNYNGGSPALFASVTGYDLATGWGTPNGQSLLTALAPPPTGANFALSPSPSALNVTQGNEGTSTITVSAVNGFTDTVDFRVTALGLPAGVTASLNPTSVTGSGTSTLTVFTADSTPVGSFPIVVTGTSGVLTQTAYVKLAVDSGQSAAGVSPTSLSFYYQVIEATSAARTVTLTGTGSTSLSISSIAVTGSDPGDFAQTNTCPATVTLGTKCTISVKFTPTALGARTATLVITDNAANSPQTVTLSGSGEAPVVLSPTSLNFGNMGENSRSTSKNIELTNNQSVALTITGITLSNPDYKETNTCAGSVAAKGSCTISVTLTPSSLGADNGTLSVNDNAPGSPQKATLTGTGLVPANLSAASLSFGSVPQSTASTAKTITFYNNEAAPLSISIATGNPDFTETNTCAGSVPAEGRCIITVTFKPSKVGAETGTLTVTDAASNSPQKASLTGTGIAQATVSPTSLTFAAQTVGTTSAAKKVALTNNLSTALTISSITFTGAAPGDFAQTDTCGASLAAKSDCTISVTFKPTATGTRTATMNVKDSANDSPQTVALTGTGK
jgi:hypothetical protein